MDPNKIMAVELLITNQETGERQLVPVATTEVFRNYWKPGCEELGLSLVTLLEDGPLKNSDIQGLISELVLLKQWFVRTQGTDNATALVRRVDNLVHVLERVMGNSALTIA
jgi:hypothetical protein